MRIDAFLFLSAPALNSRINVATSDELLDEMEPPGMWSGENWFMWPFKMISTDEIATLREERRARREADGAQEGNVNPTGEGSHDRSTTTTGPSADGPECAFRDCYRD